MTTFKPGDRVVCVAGGYGATIKTGSEYTALHVEAGNIEPLVTVAEFPLLRYFASRFRLSASPPAPAGDGPKVGETWERGDGQVVALVFARKCGCFGCREGYFALSPTCNDEHIKKPEFRLIRRTQPATKAAPSEVQGEKVQAPSEPCQCGQSAWRDEKDFDGSPLCGDCSSMVADLALVAGSAELRGRALQLAHRKYQQTKEDLGRSTRSRLVAVGGKYGRKVPLPERWALAEEDEP